jgi:hypothetical protein
MDATGRSWTVVGRAESYFTPFYGNVYWEHLRVIACNAPRLSMALWKAAFWRGSRCAGWRGQGLPFQFIELAPERLGALDKKGLPQRHVGSLSRVGMDAVYDAARFGVLPAAYRWIRERKDKPCFLDNLAACALAHGDAGTCRRVGVPSQCWRIWPQLRESTRRQLILRSLPKPKTREYGDNPSEAPPLVPIATQGVENPLI